MSVICYEQELFDNCANTIKNNRDLRSTVLYSEVYKNSKIHNYTNLEEKELVDNAITRLFWYLMVCNRVIYQLQYQDEKVNIVELNEDSKATEHYTLKQLDDKLSSISYNLTTNDGNRIVPESWIDLFESLQNRVKTERLERFDRVKENDDIMEASTSLEDKEKLLNN